MQKVPIENILTYFSDEDTYIRKSAYIALGRIYKANIPLQKSILNLLDELLASTNEKVRQTVVNAAGEIGMQDFDSIEKFMEIGLFDSHHSVRNAVIGSIKAEWAEKKNPIVDLGGYMLNVIFITRKKSI
ncbi:MAG: HEAT repeat domain-containing protein [Bacteroidetes bacterium]|nr:HEAT repeat domain-containing protein [Bacteroidota bacterium]